MIKKIYRDDAEALASFNELTRKNFWFDFTAWHAAGYFGNMYVPHAVMKAGKVVSNVSVNKMQFKVGDTIKNYIQLGTVMTDEAYRGRGLNREIMDEILQEYAGKVDGIYLFGNDSVLDYYPRFGFVPCEEYEYYLPYEKRDTTEAYTLEKVNMGDAEQVQKLDGTILSGSGNDAFYMSENLDLYHFWLDSEHSEKVYYIPEAEGYAVVTVEDGSLLIYQIFGKQQVDVQRLAAAFAGEFSEVVLGYTPVHKEAFCVRVHKEEDCTLFILGEDLECVSRERMMFPLLSHA